MKFVLLCLLAGASLLAACGKPASRAPGNCTVTATADADISQQGPFNIGFRKFQITYQPPAESGTRTIMMNLWYPTHDKTGTPAVYLDGSIIPPDQQAFDHASLAAPLSSCGYPTIEYSHGYEGLGGGASYMMRHFASHGWVAVAPDHTYDTLTDNVSPTPTSIYFEKSLDMSAVLDELEHLPPSDPLAGKVATDKVLLVGHSFGTFDVWATAGATFDLDAIRENQCANSGVTCTPDEMAVFSKGLRDPRVVAGIPMAGTLSRSWFGPSGETSVEIPLLQMTGSANDVGQYSSWPTLQNKNMTWIDLAGGCHETFNLGSCPTLDVNTGWEIARTYALAFARYYVLGDRSAQVSGIVNGTVQVSNLVTFYKK